MPDDTTDAPDGPDLTVLPDLTDWSDGQLDALAALVTSEQETRRTRAQIPGLVRSLATQWAAGDGDPAVLVDAVTDPGEQPV